MTPALMVLGTASHVGKSLVAAAFCRLLAEEGHRVAPFKAQNMSLNSYVTADGGEIGRAQVAQAEAAGVEPETDMNPILLKPMGGASQVVVDGAPIGVMTARDYYGAKDRLWPRVAAAYDRLASRYDRVVLEGAGSPVEVNLMDEDLTNLRMARHADAAVVVVADIERGGVFAQIVGTWELLPEGDRARVVGWLVNKFRGDASLLGSGLAFVRERTGVPVLGVLPYRADLQVDQEDSLGIDDTATAGDGPAEVDVAAARLPGLSNFTDLWPLGRLPGVRVRYVGRAADLGDPDLIVLPGTKTTVRDLAWLRRVGLAEAIARRAGDPDGPAVLGICGGFQMLGRTIADPLGVESAEPRAEGLGLLDLGTTFAAEKTRERVVGRVLPDGPEVVGYEIHMGQMEPGGRAIEPWLDLTRQRTGERVGDGVASGWTFGTYVHGLFDSAPFARWFVDRLRARRGLPPLDPSRLSAHRDALSARYAALAGLLRAHIDLGPVRAALARRAGPR